MSFSVISQFFLLFLVGVQNFPFLTTWPKKRTPKKKGFQQGMFKKTDMRHETAILEKKNQIQKFQLTFFAFFFLFNNKNTKIS